MRYLLTIVFSMVLWLASMAYAEAASYYVSPSGSGSTCASGAPCALNTGLGRVAAGDTLFLKGGVYDASNLQPPSGATIQGVNGETAIFRPTRGVEVGVYIPSGRSHITLKNFTLDGNDHISYGFLLEGTDIRIENVEVAYVRNQGVALYGAFDGQSQRVTLTNMHVHHTGKGPSGCNGTVSEPGYCHGLYMVTSDNVVDGGSYHDNNGYGMQNYPSGNNTIIRNARWHNNYSGGIGVFYGTNRRVYNNLIYNNNGVGLWIQNPASFFFNNTIYGNHDIGLLIRDNSDNVIRNNIVFNNSQNIQNESGGTIRVHLRPFEASGAHKLRYETQE